MPPKRKVPDGDSEDTPSSSTTTTTTTTTSSDGSSVFDKIVFCANSFPSLPWSQAEFTKLVGEHGGSVATSVTKKVTHLVGHSDDIAKGSSKIDKAKENGLFFVSDSFVKDSIAAGKKLDEADFDLFKGAPTKGKADTEKKADKEKEKEKEKEEPKKRTSSRAAAKRAAKTDSDPEDEEAPPAKKPKAAAKQSKKEEKESDNEEEEEEEDTKKDEGKKTTVIIKGRAAVDKHSGRVGDCHVLEEGNDIYDCMLNQTNIAHNNNKFYVIQVLEKDGGGAYWAWNRWGRVGETGQSKLLPCGSSKAKAIADFKKKFKDKTKNTWEDRANFTPVKGKYTLIEIDYGKDAEPTKPNKGKGKEKEKQKVTQTSSNLDNRVQDLIKLIFDLKMMEKTMIEMEFDVDKSPLGKLTKAQVKQGYAVLQELETAINKGASNSVLQELSSKFYTLIPHSFGRKVPTVIKSSEILKQKMQMLEALADIEIATKLLKESENSNLNQIDANYQLLNCEIEPVDEGDEDWNIVAKYIKNTHQTSTPKIKNLYKINRKGERDRFTPSISLGNRKLLWHGSRLTNYVGIISQGLRIAPPEAPVSGYRFGKGIYFADIASLSSIYCRSAGSNDFCMLLADVALGKEKEYERDTYMEKAPPGFNSTKALGSVEPKPSEYVNHPEGYVVPCGPVVSSGKTGVSCKEHQYIVYDVSQAHLKYLIHLNWN